MRAAAWAGWRRGTQVAMEQAAIAATIDRAVHRSALTPALAVVLLCTHTLSASTNAVPVLLLRSPRCSCDKCPSPPARDSHQV